MSLKLASVYNASEWQRLDLSKGLETPRSPTYDFNLEHFSMCLQKGAVQYQCRSIAQKQHQRALPETIQSAGCRERSRLENQTGKIARQKRLAPVLYTVVSMKSSAVLHTLDLTLTLIQKNFHWHRWNFYPDKVYGAWPHYTDKE